MFSQISNFPVAIILFLQAIDIYKTCWSICATRSSGISFTDTPTSLKSLLVKCQNSMLPILLCLRLGMFSIFCLTREFTASVFKNQANMFLIGKVFWLWRYFCILSCCELSKRVLAYLSAFSCWSFLSYVCNLTGDVRRKFVKQTLSSTYAKARGAGNAGLALM